jgi:hypothetical protein
VLYFCRLNKNKSFGYNMRWNCFPPNLALNIGAQWTGIFLSFFQCWKFVELCQWITIITHKLLCRPQPQSNHLQSLF